MKHSAKIDQPVRVDGELLNGYGNQELTGGRSYTGNWKNGIPHGQGVMTFPGGRFEGEYHFGYAVSGRVSSDDGFHLEGEFYEGQIQGQGKARWPDGCTYEGDIGTDGRPHGHGVWELADGSRYEGECMAGWREGKGVLIQPDGTRLEGWFEKDEYMGPEVPADEKKK